MCQLGVPLCRRAVSSVSSKKFRKNRILSIIGRESHAYLLSDLITFPGKISLAGISKISSILSTVEDDELAVGWLAPRHAKNHVTGLDIRPLGC